MQKTMHLQKHCSNAMLTNIGVIQTHSKW